MGDASSHCTICKGGFTNSLFVKEFTLDETFETIFAKMKIWCYSHDIEIIEVMTLQQFICYYKSRNLHNTVDLYKFLILQDPQIIKYIPVNHPNYKEFIKATLAYGSHSYRNFKNKIDKEMKKYALTISPGVYFQFSDEDQHDIELCEYMASIGKIDYLPIDMITCDILKLAFANGFAKSITVPASVIANADTQLENIISTNYDVDAYQNSFDDDTGDYNDVDYVGLKLKPAHQCDTSSEYFINAESRSYSMRPRNDNVARSIATHTPMVPMQNYTPNPAIQYTNIAPANMQNPTSQYHPMQHPTPQYHPMSYSTPQYHPMQYPSVYHSHYPHFW
jgi:hypothetical protein